MASHEPRTIRYGTNGADRIATRGNSEGIHGLGGGDILTSDYNYTTLWGDGGDDRLTVLLPFIPQFGPLPADQSARVFGGEGNDTIRLGRHYEGQDSLFGGVGVDTAFFADGGEGNDTITLRVATEYGRDWFSFTLNGGAGNDRISVDINPRDLPLDIWDADVTGVVTGGAGADVINVRALAGADPYGGDLDLQVDGGEGSDMIFVAATVNEQYIDTYGSVVVDGGAGADLIESALVMDTSDGTMKLCSHTVTGGAGDDRMTIRSTADSLPDDTGQVTALAGSGNDWVKVVTRGEGVDFETRLDGGTGNDTLLLFAGQGTQANVIGGAGNDIARVIVSGAYGGGTEPAEVRVSGLSGDDTLAVSFVAGATGSARLSGGTNFGDDVLQVTGGDHNLLIAGGGEDTLIGGTGSDGFMFWEIGDQGSATVRNFDRSKDILVFSFVSDYGAPGLADDVQYLRVVEDGKDVLISDSIRIVGAATGAVDSVLDLVEDPTTQIVNHWV